MRRARSACAAVLVAGLAITVATFAVRSAVPTRPTVPALTQPTVDPELAAFAEHFALNALLVPLLDGDEYPPRWGDPELTMPCAAAVVTVDGHPVPVGHELSGRAFSVHWRMGDCLPFGVDGPRLSGEATLDVYPDDAGMTANVRLSRMQVERQGRVAFLDRAFVATTR